MKTLQERFEAKFIKTDGCWNWTAYKVKGGYGQFYITTGQMQYAHRVAYQLYVGEIPDGLFCLHRCDNRGCVNPTHLFLGTIADNTHDCMAKGRRADTSGEKNNRAKLTEEQVRIIKTKHSAGARNVDLAKEFGVGRSAISQIVCGRNWTEI